jgi:hypothetical protein
MTLFFVGRKSSFAKRTFLHRRIRVEYKIHSTCAPVATAQKIQKALNCMYFFRAVFYKLEVNEVK